MTREQAEALASRILAELDHLDVQVVYAYEIFGGSDDGTYCCELIVPGEPRPTDICKRLARVIDNESDWQSFQNVARLARILPK